MSVGEDAMTCYHSKLLPVLVLALGLGTVPTAVFAKENAAAEIARTIRERLDAASRGDAAAWANYVDDNCLCAGESKADIRRSIASRPPGVKIQYGDIVDLQAHAFAGVLVARYRVAESVMVNGELRTAEQWRTETYVRADGRWILVAGAENLISPDPEPVAVGRDVLSRYVGRYEYTRGAVDTVTLEGDQLYVQPTGEPKVPLFPEDSHTFFAKGQAWRLVFHTNTDGLATSLVFRQHGQDYVATRIP